MKFSDKEMAALISEVEVEFSEHLKKAEPTAKQPEKKVKKAEPKKVAKSEEQPKSKEKEVEFNYNDEDIAEMNDLYSSMTKSELSAHYKSVKTALYGEKEESTPAPVATTPVVETAPVTKSEASSDEISKLKEENAKLEKGLAELVNKLSGFVKKTQSAPQQKAITKIEYIAKSEDEKKPEAPSIDVSKLSTTEISSRLSEKARTDLKKSDREAINNFYLNKTDIQSIRHLL